MPRRRAQRQPNASGRRSDAARSPARQRHCRRKSARPAQSVICLPPPDQPDQARGTASCAASLRQASIRNPALTQQISRVICHRLIRDIHHPPVPARGSITATLATSPSKRRCPIRWMQCRRRRASWDVLRHLPRCKPRLQQPADTRPNAWAPCAQNRDHRLRRFRPNCGLRRCMPCPEPRTLRISPCGANVGRPQVPARVACLHRQPGSSSGRI